MELCPICGDVSPHQTIQCPRIRTAPVCWECHRACRYFSFSPVAPGQCRYHLSDEYREREQREVNARGIRRMREWTRQWEESHGQDGSGHREDGG